jgi:hypothetical protein
MFFRLAELLNQPNKLDPQMENTQIAKKIGCANRKQIFGRSASFRLCGLAELICGQPTVGDKSALFTTLP